MECVIHADECSLGCITFSPAASFEMIAHFQLLLAVDFLPYESAITSEGLPVFHNDGPQPVAVLIKSFLISLNPSLHFFPVERFRKQTHRFRIAPDFEQII